MARNFDYPTWVEYQIRCGWEFECMPSGNYGQCQFHEWIPNFLPHKYVNVADQTLLVLGPNPWAGEVWQHNEEIERVARRNAEFMAPILEGKTS